MRTALLLVMLALSSTAHADYAKAWTAAQNNLPAGTKMVAAIDVAAIVKSSQFPPVLAALRKAEREFDIGYRTFEQRCKVDPMTLLEGVVVAGDPQREVVVFAQLALDREKASACLLSVYKGLAPTKKTTIVQDGIYTVVTIVGSKTETAYFGWVAPNVVAVVFDNGTKQALDQWIGHKDFSKSPVAPLFAKTDRKAVIAGAYIGKPLKAGVTSAYGDAKLAGGKVAVAMVGIAPDAATATAGAAELDRDTKKQRDRDRTPPVVKAALSKVAITAKGTQISIAATLTEKELADVVLAELAPIKAPPPPPPPSP